MTYSHTLRGERFVFPDLRTLFAQANEEKSGDQLAGLAADTQRRRAAAKCALADVTLGEIVDTPLLDPDEDSVSRVILETHDASRFAPFRSWTVGRLREYLLDDDVATSERKPSERKPSERKPSEQRPSEQEPSELEPSELESLAFAWTPEIMAAVAKLMSNKDLVLAASRVRKVTRCRNTMGQRGVFGVRVQPNHPTDDIGGILLAAVEGLLYGCGDAVIGVNPATESIDAVESILRGLDRLIRVCRVPTQACCLAHITTQLACLERGAPVDLLFQSIAGTQRANESFGVTVELLGEGRQRVLEQHAARQDVTWVGSQVMYFETGQGSALSAEAHHGIDQLTLEARAYGLARAFDPFLINSVVGFIGPEYLFDERQITRAGLEDHFMGKLLGLPMGCDVCYTNHAAADQNSADNLLMLLAAAGCNYVMGVPCSDDIMLNYQSTSYHDAASIRSLLGLRPAPEFAAWLEQLGIVRNGRLTSPPIESQRLLFATAAEKS